MDGHGYGLLVCKQIVESHGGSIRVESDLRSGSTFIIAFPVSL
jgi:signal transduction histidine kinase